MTYGRRDVVCYFPKTHQYICHPRISCKMVANVLVNFGYVANDFTSLAVSAMKIIDNLHYPWWFKYYLQMETNI